MTHAMPAPDMDPVVSVLLRRFELHLRQLDKRIRVEGDPFCHVFRMGQDTLAVISLHYDLFRVRTGAHPAWEARIRNPEEARDALMRILEQYWRLVAQADREP